MRFNSWQATLLLALLSVIPIWLVPIAPLTDWPTHLAIAKEAYTLWSSGLPHAFYYLDFSFLGYALVYALLMALQLFVSWQTAGQIVLMLLFLLAPFGWRFFFGTLDPSKSDWAILGLLMNYSVFFYWGNISFLFAIPLGLIWLALGLEAMVRKPPRFRPLPFLLSGMATYLAHAYVFLMLGGLMLLVYAYLVLWKGRPASRWMIFALLFSLALCGANAVFHSTHSTSLAYYNQAQACATAQVQAVQPAFNSRQFTGEWLMGVLSTTLDPLFIFYSIQPLLLLALVLLFALLSFGLFALWQFTQHGRPLSQTLAQYGPKLPIRLAPLYLALAILLYVHALVVPDCTAFICNMGQRSLPFAFAFLALAVDSKRLIRPVFLAACVLVALNILFQAAIFWHAAPLQASILAQTQQIAAQLPANATVFVQPSNWTSLYIYSPFPPYPNTYYQALLVAYAPSAYVAGLYGAQDTFLLRSRFPLFDDMAHFGPHPSLLPAGTNVSLCYAQVPAQYQFVVDGHMQLRPNPAAPRQ